MKTKEKTKKEKMKPSKFAILFMMFIEFTIAVLLIDLYGNLSTIGNVYLTTIYALVSTVWVLGILYYLFYIDCPERNLKYYATGGSMVIFTFESLAMLNPSLLLMFYKPMIIFLVSALTVYIISLLITFKIETIKRNKTKFLNIYSFI